MNPEKLFRSVCLFLLILSCLILFPKESAEAAKKFISKKVGGGKTAVSSSIPAIVRFRPDRLGLLLSFSRFTGIESVSYSFTYNTNNTPQGAGGTIIKDNNPTAVRELLFGTCSSGVCKYHNNISGARLTLTAKLSNGRTAFKSYRIKTYQ